jgi:hypothetical protein
LPFFATRYVDHRNTDPLAHSIELLEGTWRAGSTERRKDDFRTGDRRSTTTATRRGGAAGRAASRRYRYRSSSAGFDRLSGLSGDRSGDAVALSVVVGQAPALVAGPRDLVGRGAGLAFERAESLE